MVQTNEEPGIMASFSTNEFKSGLKVLLEGEPCSIVENEFVKPSIIGLVRKYLSKKIRTFIKKK